MVKQRAVICLAGLLRAGSALVGDVLTHGWPDKQNHIIVKLSSQKMGPEDAFVFFPGKGIYTTPNSGLHPAVEVYQRDEAANIIAAFSHLTTGNSNTAVAKKFSSAEIAQAERLFELHGSASLLPKTRVVPKQFPVVSLAGELVSTGMRSEYQRTYVSWSAIELLLKKRGYYLKKRSYSNGSVSDLAPVYVIASPQQGVISEGKGFTETQSKYSALAEAIERLYAIPDDTGSVYLGSQDELNDEGFVPYTVLTGPRDTFTEKTVTEWVPAVELNSGMPAFLPAELAYYGYTPKHPRMRNFALHHTTGLAVGASVEEAAVGALLEIVERDAYWITMRCKINHPDIDVSQVIEIDQRTVKIIEAFNKQGFDVIVKDMSLDWGVPIAHAVLVDRKSRIPAFAHGSGAAFDWPTAINRAVTEVVQMHSGMTDLMSDPDNWERVVSVSDVLGRGELAWSDPLFKIHIDHCIERSDTVCTQQSIQYSSPSRLLHYLGSKGYQVLVSPLREVCGLHIVRVYLPQATQPDERLERISGRMEEFRKQYGRDYFYSDPILT